MVNIFEEKCFSKISETFSRKLYTIFVSVSENIFARIHGQSIFNSNRPHLNSIIQLLALFSHFQFPRSYSRTDKSEVLGKIYNSVED